MLCVKMNWIFRLEFWALEWKNLDEIHIGLRPICATVFDGGEISEQPVRGFQANFQ